MRWHILTGEYAPLDGGVGDYTRLVAQGLAAEGDDIVIWTPTPRGAASHDEAGSGATDDRGVTVQRLPDHFGARSLALLTRRLRGEGDPHRVLVQYVPHAFGWKGTNVPFCLWLRSRARNPVWVMFHEVAFPIACHQRLSHNALGVVTRGMAALVASAAERVFVSIPAWEPRLRRLTAPSTPIEWMPVPSAIPVDANAAAVAAARARYAGGGPLIGHFGTFGPLIRPLLLDALPAVAEATDARVLLMGRDSDAAAAAAIGRWPALRDRVSGTGALEPRAVSHHVAACDVMLQPYPDGVSSRRTSVMAALAHGRPVVTTIGELSERIWHRGAGVIACPVGDVQALARGCAAVVSTPSERARLSVEARTLYDDRFDLRHTIALLRTSAGPAGLRAAS